MQQQRDKARAALTAAQAEYSAAQTAEANARVYENNTLKSQDAAALRRIDTAQKAIDRAVEELNYPKVKEL